MKKLFMLLVLGGLISCASLYAEDEDFKIQMDEEDTVYQSDDEEDNFKIGYIDDEKIGYIDDEKVKEWDEE